jgi:hypothetical protein
VIIPGTLSPPLGPRPPKELSAAVVEEEFRVPATLASPPFREPT